MDYLDLMQFAKILPVNKMFYCYYLIICAQLINVTVPLGIKLLRKHSSESIAQNIKVY